MAFDWEKVNEPVEEETFTYCDLDIPPLTPVVSVPFKNTKGVSERLGDVLYLCGTKEGRLLNKQLADRRAFRARLPFLVTGLTWIVIAVIMKAYRRRKA